jgi:N-acetylmuramoyl-L-alanine amidase
VLVLAGCSRNGQLREAGNVLITSPLGSISIYQLASRLNLKVVESDSIGATLRDEANTIVIFADPNGQAYVNAQPVGEPGGIVPAGGMLFVPQVLEGEIRLALRPRRAPQSRHLPVPKPVERLGTVILDPGHGGDDPGAISVYGLSEKTVNLEVATAAAEILTRSGVDVVMTRQADQFVDLEERAAMANGRRPALFVSIHADAAHNRDAAGFTVYVARLASRQSQRAAEAIADCLISAGVSSRGIRTANYRVLVRTTCPAVLVELGYLSNSHDAAWLGNAGYRQKLSQAVAEGVIDFLNQR